MGNEPTSAPACAAGTGPADGPAASSATQSRKRRIAVPSRASARRMNSVGACAIAGSTSCTTTSAAIADCATTWRGSSVRPTSAAVQPSMPSRVPNSSRWKFGRPSRTSRCSSRCR